MSDGRISNGGNRDQRIEKTIRVVADAPQQKRKRNLGELKMKRLITVCAVVVIMCALPNVAQATLWEIQDAGLQDANNFVRLATWADGVLNSRSDIPGDPGTQFNITLSSGNYDIIIADNFDLPLNNSGLVSATGNSGDLSGYTGYTMTIHNPSSTTFNAAIVMNTGWNKEGWTEPDNYYQDTTGGTAITPGGIATLLLDFDDAAVWDYTIPSMLPGQTVMYPNHVTNIGLKIWTDGTAGPFNVNVVPEPATIALLGLGSLSLIRVRRKTRA